MTNFIVPVLSLMLTFLSILSTGKHLLSRRGFYWILPFILSLIFSYSNLTTLLWIAQGNEVFVFSIENLLPLVTAILWYAMVQAFHFALKKERSYNNYVDESRRNWNEAMFVEKFERRKTVKEIEERKESHRNKPVQPRVSNYNSFPDWDD